jgi:chromosome segregation ATPase
VAETDLDFDDWTELLGVRETMTALTEGRASPGQVLTELAAARMKYPGAMGDYIRVIEGLETFVDTVADAIAEQNDRLTEFSEAVAEAGVLFTWDHSRLLSEEKQQEISRIEEYLQILAARAEEAANEAENGVEEIQDQIDALEEQLAGLGEQADAIQQQIAELEEQLAAAEEGGDEDG